MCEIDFLSRIIETNGLILSLTLDQLVKTGQENSELLRRAFDVYNSDEQAMQSSIFLSYEQKERFNTIFRNIIILSNSINADCQKAAFRFAKTVKTVLVSFTTFQKIKMPDDVKSKYEDIIAKADSESELEILLIDIRNLLYE
mgnify:CR=1 FL=1